MNRCTCIAKDTCAFDSILQLILLAVSEIDMLKNEMRTTENDFFKLVLRTLMHDKGIDGPNMYNMRTKMLYSYLGNEPNRSIVQSKLEH